jgi:hypothetical protein
MCNGVQPSATRALLTTAPAAMRSFKTSTRLFDAARNDGVLSRLPAAISRSTMTTLPCLHAMHSGVKPSPGRSTSTSAPPVITAQRVSQGCRAPQPEAGRCSCLAVHLSSGPRGHPPHVRSPEWSPLSRHQKPRAQSDDRAPRRVRGATRLFPHPLAPLSVRRALDVRS